MEMGKEGGDLMGRILMESMGLPSTLDTSDLINQSQN